MKNINNVSNIESSFDINKLSNSIGLESLIVNNSDLNFNLNDQLYEIDELNLKFQNISVDSNSVSLYIDDLSGLINKKV